MNKTRREAAETKSIFEYQDYKTYLNDTIEAYPNRGRGIQIAIAKQMRCQSAYVSQVLHGKAHFSLEQADVVNQFFGHTSEESDYFFDLLQFARAGTTRLKQHFRAKMEQAIQRRLTIKNRVDVQKTLGVEEQAVYYSVWYFAAVHVLLTIPEFQNKERIAHYLALPISRVSEVLQFLEQVGLACQKGNRYVVTEARIHLPGDSPLISKHHTNWRMKAISSLERELEEDLHYSSVISVAADDVSMIKSLFLETITRFRKIVRDSKEEKLFALTFDFFRAQ